MKSHRAGLISVLAGLSAIAGLLASVPARAQEEKPVPPAIQDMARTIAAELAVPEAVAQHDEGTGRLRAVGDPIVIG